MIDVSTLGAFDVRDAARGRVASLLVQPRRAALFAYLVVEGRDGFVSRDALLALFWPEYDESRARAALRQALAFLRRTLGDDVLVGRGDDAIGVNPAAVTCDLWRWQDALRAGAHDDALTQVRGPLLDGLIVDDAPDFDRWLSAQRDRVAREASVGAAALASARAAAGNLTGAVSAARRAQSLAPFNEATHRLLLTLLDQQGDRGGALHAHEQFAALLHAELGATPSPETSAVVAGLRARVVPAVPSGGAGGGVSAVPAAAVVTVASAASAASAAAPVSPSPAASPPHRRRTGRFVAVAGGLLALAALWSRRPAPVSPPAPGEGRVAVQPALSPSRVVVLPFTDVAADASQQSAGMMAADWLTEGLSRVEGLSIIPATAVLATDAALRRAVPATATNDSVAAADAATAADAAESWRRLATDVGAGIVVRGTIYREPPLVHLQAQVVETATGRLLRPVERVSVPAGRFMSGVDLLRTRVVAAVAPLTDSVTHLRRAIAPPTYEAYRDYVNGLARFVQGDVPAALVLFERSAAADAAYPMPRIAASIARLNLGEADRAQRLLAPLHAERPRLGPLEQSTLDMVDGMLRGDLPRAYDAVRRQARIAPGTIGEYMVAELARKMHRPTEAVQVLRALGPDRGELRGWRPYWRELTFALHLQGAHGEELEAARDAARRYPDSPVMVSYVVRALAALGDTSALRGQLTQLDAMGASPASRAATRVMLATEVLHHHPALRAVALPPVMAWLDSLTPAERAAPAVRRAEAQLWLLARNPARATQVLAPLLARLLAAPRSDTSPTVVDHQLAGRAAALAGDAAGARRQLSALDALEAARTPAQRGLSWGEIAYARAVIAAQSGDSARALSHLRQARREGLGMEPVVHAEPAFHALRTWPPFAALLTAGGAGAGPLLRSDSFPSYARD